MIGVNQPLYRPAKYVRNVHVKIVEELVFSHHVQTADEHCRPPIIRCLPKVHARKGSQLRRMFDEFHFAIIDVMIEFTLSSCENCGTNTRSNSKADDVVPLIQDLGNLRSLFWQS